MKLSAFGEKFAGDSGIVELMDDLGNALSENPDMIFMGGGNPGRLPAVEQVFRENMESILEDPQQRHSLFGIYQSPQGEKEFRKEVAAFLNKQFGWSLSCQNIAVSNGSQSAFFMLYNMLAGEMSDDTRRAIHLPLSPEYLGYRDVGLTSSFFTATRPKIERLEDHLFKYHIDFSNLNVDHNTAAMCVSRPTNPTGNVLTDNEISMLDELARANDIPLIIDGAYGLPFPNIIFTEVTPFWNDNTILVLSLSKLGLPGARTGIVVASEEVIQAFTRANAVISLSCGTMGPALAHQMFRNDQILSLSRDHILPFYRERSTQVVDWFRQEMGDLPYQIHKPEGAIFLWVWFEGLPIGSQEMYQRLKQRGVLVVPGHNFFVGIEDEWAHKNQCLRVSYAQDADTVRQGVRIIAEEARKAYDLE
ncbi:valine--pyruvate transaminase [Hahella ganghwensis]|uniref:valine--pyruvate transaminase n=1 Tax=Hahella ganghwensis TaxID=286420 RepID=UPI00037AA755|nr:valine--pyruvate transaminase [Hahella ganghwensis]